MHSSMCAVIYVFVHALLHLLVHSFSDAFVHSVDCVSTHSCMCLFVLSCVVSHVHSFVGSLFVGAFVHWFVHVLDLVNHSSVCSFVHSVVVLLFIIYVLIDGCHIPQTTKVG